MSDNGGATAAPLVPEHPTLDTLRAAAAGCRACDLWTKGTQTVFDEGEGLARLMLVGEQPGDEEDQAGRPFVGPAGRLLDRALREAGIDRRQTWVTNAVKHFNWEGTRGKRRIHKKPAWYEITACKPWLDWEINLVRPKAVVLMGATAAQSLLGRDFKVTQHRGELIESGQGALLIPTVHPSSILRAPDDAARHEQMQAFIDDLRRVAPLVAA